MKAKAQTTHHAKCQLDKKKNFQNHLSGVVVDLLGVHSLPIDQSNIQLFLRADDTQAKWSATVCLDSYLWRGWIFDLSMGKKWSPSRSTTTPDKWYRKFFFGDLQTHLSCHEEVTWLWTFPLLIFLIQLTESWDFKKKIPVPYPIICNVQRLRPFAWTRHSRPHWLDLSKWTDGRTLLLLLGKNWNTLLLPRWNLPTPGSFLRLQST